MQPSNNNGSIIIRFTKFGYKYSLTKLGSFDDKDNHYEAVRICRAIELDISMGRFTATNNDELFKAYHPLAKLSSHHEANTYAVDALTLVEQKIALSQFKDKALSPCVNLLKSYGKAIKSHDDASTFFRWMSNDGKRSNNSNNRYLEALAPICPMFKDVPRLKANQVAVEKPFSKTEIQSIINVFDKNYPEYRVFIRFLFATGCRTNEATALKFEHIDWDNNTVTIKNAAAIASDGSKVIKGTKTGVVRTIPINLKLKMLLAVEYEIYDKSGYDHGLVFTTSNGKLIDTNNFRSRVWVEALKLAKVPYRTLYNTRHTFCSHFLNETPDFVKLASITHNSKSGVQTLIKHYAHLVNNVVMPDMF